ncbi:hypothetical protein HMI54_005117 [Coelomomyces lativittatus]|nr:hypothetical protein HMI54_005117 [Coelomomyces lativittatus]KAJ1508072.1 hypothetical protein HMI56_007475 [Coelomomyces lativittatus]KAJ1517392.1 hypothetical protein HMI55_007229 [Coelomomyces lativittatus]
MLFRRFLSYATKSFQNEDISKDLIRKNVNKVILCGLVASAPKFYPFKNSQGYVSQFPLKTYDITKKSDGTETTNSVTHTIKSFSNRNYTFLKENVQEGTLLYVVGKLCVDRIKSKEQGDYPSSFQKTFSVRVDGPDGQFIVIPPEGELPEQLEGFNST